MRYRVQKNADYSLTFNCHLTPSHAMTLANLCTILTSLKSGDPGLSLFALKQKAPQNAID